MGAWSMARVLRQRIDIIEHHVRILDVVQCIKVTMSQLCRIYAELDTSLPAEKHIIKHVHVILYNVPVSKSKGTGDKNESVKYMIIESFITILHVHTQTMLFVLKLTCSMLAVAVSISGDLKKDCTTCVRYTCLILGSSIMYIYTCACPCFI